MIDLPGYIVEREIGRGAFATVYLASPTTAPTRHVAIKAIRTVGLTKKLAEALAAEIAIMRSIRDPHIVHLESIERRGRQLFLVMEWCEGGDFAALLRTMPEGLDEQTAGRYVGQLAAAVKVLRQANLVHRDIKPQNLLLSRDHSCLKLADFGFARYVEEDNLAETLCGSPLYMYDERADLWSVGAVLYEMLFTRPPFRAQNHIQLLKVIEKSGGKLEYPRQVSRNARDLLEGLLQIDPQKRLDFQKFFTHPFLSIEDSIGGENDIFIPGRPIPIRRSLASSSSSSFINSSPLQTRQSGISVAFARRYSVPTSLGQMPQQPSLLTGSSREQLIVEDEQTADRLPIPCNVSIKKGLILSDLFRKLSNSESNQLLAMQSFRFFVSGLKHLQQQDDIATIAWIMSKIKDLEEIIDFTSAPSFIQLPRHDGTVSLFLYDYAVRVAIEGGFQELLGRSSAAQMHYSRSLFILEHFAPIPLNGAVIEEYRKAINERLQACSHK